MTWTRVGANGTGHYIAGVSTTNRNTTGANLLLAISEGDASRSFFDSFGNTWTSISLPFNSQSTALYLGLSYCIDGLVGSGHVVLTGGAGSPGVALFDAMVSSVGTPTFDGASGSVVIVNNHNGSTSSFGDDPFTPNPGALTYSVLSQGLDSVQLLIVPSNDGFQGAGLTDKDSISQSSTRPSVAYARTTQDTPIGGTYWGFISDGIYLSVSFGPGISGTISRPNSDVSVSGWTFNGASLSASIGETTRSDTDYAQAPFGVSPAITGISLSLSAGNYTITFAGEYLTGFATSGQFRFSLLDGSNTVLGTSAWQAVTSSVVQYDVPITITGTATRIQIEIQA